MSFWKALKSLFSRKVTPEPIKSQNFNRRPTISVGPDREGSHLQRRHKLFIQRKLAKLGLYDAKLYADLVPAAIQAVESFQATRGLEVDGIVGPNTWNALVSAEPGPVVLPPESDATGPYAAAMADLGLQEIVGGTHNPRIIEMFAKSGHSWVQDDETAWCAAAMNTWLLEGGLRGTGKLNARSFLDWAVEHTGKPEKGIVAVFERGNSAWQGHVAFCTGRETATHIEVLGGNQQNQVNKQWKPKKQLLGLRKAA